ncbi:MAG TPA: exodeoxyribonuclease VII small subunit [Abditibacteriaceae bacterium]|jgi:exodeoxyribonuclease VII small subunit
MNTDAQSALPFEAALQELDGVVSKLEAGQISLEESLALLQRGMELAQHCDETLSNAESVLEQLTLSPGGELVAQRLAWADDDDEDDEDDE